MDIERAIWIGEEFAGLILFLLAAMTYINTLEERRVFQALRLPLRRRFLPARHYGFFSRRAECAASRRPWIWTA